MTSKTSIACVVPLLFAASAFGFLNDAGSKISSRSSLVALSVQPEATAEASVASSQEDESSCWSELFQASQNGDPQQAESILNAMRASPDQRPNLKAYTMTFQAYAKSASPDIVKRSESLLRRMWLDYKAGILMDGPPTEFAYNSVINAHAKQLLFLRRNHQFGDAEALQQRETYEYQRAGGRIARGDDDAQNNEAVDNANDEALATAQATPLSNSGAMMIPTFYKDGKPSIKRVMELLHEMQFFSATSTATHMKPSVVTYNSVIHCLAQIGDYDTAEAILDDMIQESKPLGDSAGTRNGDGDEATVQPDPITYNAVISAFSNSPQAESSSPSSRIPERAQALLTLMENHPSPEVKPDIVTYNSVLSCWAKSGRLDAGERADALLQRMKTEECGVQPCLISYNTVLSAWSRSMVKPSARRGTDHAPSKDAPRRAELILKELQELYRSKKQKNALHHSMKPDIYTYTTVIDFCAQSRQKVAADRAATILFEMKDLLEPNTITYNAVLKAYAKVGEAEKAESLLQDMIEGTMQSALQDDQADTTTVAVLPDRISFNTVLDAWSKSRSPDAPERAELLFEQMDRYHEEGIIACRPDTVSFNTLINCWAKASSARPHGAQRADDLLTTLQQRYRQSDKSHDLRPTTITYSSVIAAWARSRKTQAADRALELLGAMNANRHLRPTVLTYNAVLRAVVASPILSDKETIDHVGGVLRKMKKARIATDGFTKKAIAPFADQFDL